MCGFVGYWDRDGGAASEVVLEKMIERIRYRGPDDKGTWTKGPVGLGHCRLSIIDLSPRGHQPFVTADGKGVLAYNGEVYNFKELRMELEKEGVQFKSSTDTEVVLYALHLWGPEKAIPMFNGMFGFAYYDLRDQTLWIARDRTGIKPAYIARSGNLIAFASEIKAILAHPKIFCKPDIHALGHFLTYQRFEGDWTPFENIEQVTAGSYLKIMQNRIEQTVYFDVLRDLNVERIIENSKRTTEELVKEFESAISESVKMHLISDAPLATMCSGGIDSSLTTAFAKDLKPDIVAYVANVVGPVSEGRKAKLVGRHIGAKVRQIDVNREDLLRYWPTAIWHGDQPNAHANDMPYIMVTRACHKDGIKVVLTGEGADELFGGYPWQEKTYHMWHLRRLHNKFIPNSKFFQALGHLHPKLKPFDFESLKKFPFVHLEELEFCQEMLRQSSITDAGRRLLRQRALLEKLEAIEPIEDRAFLARTFEDWYGNLQAVLHRNDRISMAASVESRPPFLENRLIDIGMHFPARVKYHKGEGKWIVKQVGEKKLPREIVYGQKLHFPVAMDTFRGARALIETGLLPQLFKWSVGETNLLLEEAAQNHTVIYNLLGVELWARMFLNGDSREELGETLLSVSQNGNGVHKPSYRHADSGARINI